MDGLPEVRPVCVDASLAVATLVPEPVSPQADAAWQSWSDEGRLLIAPPHFVAEVLTAIRRAGLRDDEAAAAEGQALDIFLHRILLGVSLSPYRPEICRRAWEWARRLRRANVYDTLYLAVAEEAGAEFWTADGNLVRALEADGSERPKWVHLIEP